MRAEDHREPRGRDPPLGKEGAAPTSVMCCHPKRALACFAALIPHCCAHQTTATCLAGLLATPMARRQPSTLQPGSPEPQGPGFVWLPSSVDHHNIA